jgi:aminomethyltransferase
VPDLTRQTVLLNLQKAAGARCIIFGGWDMPVQFTSIIDEHQAVRQKCGVFDISHMGEIFVSGLESLSWLQHMLTNNLSKCAKGEAQYTFLLNDRGGIIDDLIVYRLRADEFLLLVNAAKIEEDMVWLNAHLVEGVTIDNRSDAMSALALQGPQSARIFSEVFGQQMPSRNTITRLGDIWAAGTGYTGEAGCELFVANEKAPDLWTLLIDSGAKPCGLGARDTLRLEMCYPLNGSDLSSERTPLEAGLGMFVDLDKPEFIGREAMVHQKKFGTTVRLAAIRMTENSPPPRAHYPVMVNGAVVAETTSGALSPSTGNGIALAYLPAALCHPGQPVSIDIRGKQFTAVVEKKPFYRPSLSHTA